MIKTYSEKLSPAVIKNTFRKVVHLWLHNRASDSLSLQFSQADLASSDMTGKIISVEIKIISVEGKHHETSQSME